MDTVSKLTVYFEDPFWKTASCLYVRLPLAQSQKMMKSGSSFSSTMTGWCSALRLHLK